MRITEKRPSARGIAEIVKNVSPLWFAVSLGTGMTSMLLHQLPYNVHGIRVASMVLFVLNILVFTVELALCACRFTFYPQAFGAVLKNHMQALSLPLIPMSFATLINMTVFVCVPIWGWWATTLVWVLWWIDAGIAFLACSLLAFEILWTHNTTLSNLTSSYLFPVLAPIVAASSGGLIAEVLPNTQQARSVSIASYVLWSIGVFPALALIVLYLFSLLQHRLPPKDQIISLFLPIGPFGLGTFGLIKLGDVGRVNFLDIQSSFSDGSLSTMSLLLAFPLWVCGLWWLLFAAISAIRSKASFGVNWWNTIFPTGALALATIMIGDKLDSAFFKIFGMVLSAISIALWLITFIGTSKMIHSKKILATPFMADIFSSRDEQSV